MTFKKATKEKAKLRCALIGPAGSGKTYTSLRVASALIKNARILVIDTEKKTAKKYADDFEFFVEELITYEPLKAVEIINEADQQGFDILIIDSLSHFWMGSGGMLDQVDAIAKRKSAQRGGSSPNTFEAWKDANPMEKKLWDAVLGCNMHVFATLRTKTEYIIEENEKGKKAPRKIGLAPIQRDGLEYEFDVVADLDIDNNLVVGKTRCKALKGYFVKEAGEEFAGMLSDWLNSGAEPAVDEKKTEEPAPPIIDRNKEADGCKNLEELKIWYSALPARERNSKSVATAAKDKRKKELEPEDKTQPEQETKLTIESMIESVNSKSTKAQLEMVDILIERQPNEKKVSLIDSFQAQIDKFKINYEIKTLPF